MKQGVTLLVLMFVMSCGSPESVELQMQGYTKDVAVPQPWFASQLGHLSSASHGGPISLEVVDIEENDRAIAGRLYASYRQAIAAGGRVMVSANMVDAVLKEIFDTILAGLEQAEIGPMSRRQLLESLRAGVEGGVREFLQAAIELDEGVSASPRSRAFLQDPMKSRPIGFYTWTRTLENDFRRDRFLQTPLEPVEREALRKAMNERSRAAYEWWIRYRSVVTNPPMDRHLLQEAGDAERVAFFPRARANEIELMELMRRAGEEVPDDLMGEFLRRIKDGRVDLRPRADSGFFDYQQWALEAYLTAPKNPEGTRVRFGKKYLQRLEESFKTGVTKARESHIKDVAIGMKLASIEPPGPFLPLEPLPSVYARYAEAFDYLRRELARLVDLDKVTTYHPEEPPRSIRCAINEARALCYGLALLACDEIGLQRIGLEGFDAEACLKEARAWMVRFTEDARLARDTRFAVPVFVDVDERGNPAGIHFWGTAGVMMLTVEAEQGGRKKKYWIAVDKFVSFRRPYRAGPLTREEYRRILNRCGTLKEALRELEAAE